MYSPPPQHGQQPAKSDEVSLTPPGQPYIPPRKGAYLAYTLDITVAAIFAVLSYLPAYSLVPVACISVSIVYSGYMFVRTLNASQALIPSLESYIIFRMPILVINVVGAVALVIWWAMWRLFSSGNFSSYYGFIYMLCMFVYPASVIWLGFIAKKALKNLAENLLLGQMNTPSHQQHTPSDGQIIV